MENPSENTKEKLETLYLMVKMLKSTPGFENSFQALERDMRENKILGDLITLNGETQPQQLENIHRTFPSLPDNHIVLHLRNSLQSRNSSFQQCRSLFTRLTGIYNPFDEKQISSFKQLSLKILEANCSLRAMIRNEKHLLFRLKSDELEFPVIDDVIDLSVEPAVSTNGNQNSSTGDVVSTLQTIGRSKEILHLSSQLTNQKTLMKVVEEDLKSLTIDLTKLGCAASGVNRGNIDSSLDWLINRPLGLTSAGFSHGFSISRGLGPSSRAVRNKILSNYKVQWTISGHMMNPAYCTVFDRTGQFLLSGADDYLVKIWDIQRGLLVKTCKGHMGYISLIEVSPDNSLFASACTMGTIRIWRMSDGVCIQVLKHKAAVNWLKFDTSTCALASGSDDGQCIVWDLSKLLPKEGGEVPLLDAIHEQLQVELQLQEEQQRVLAREVERLRRDQSGRTNNPLLDFTGLIAQPAVGCSSNSAPFDSQLDIQLGVGSSSSAAEVHGAPVGMRFEVQNGHGVSGPAAGPFLYAAPTFSSRGGLFEWSGVGIKGSGVEGRGFHGDMSGASGSMLVLPHIQDVFHPTAREGDHLRVTCLDILPIGDIVVTGCEDGVARVWRYNDRWNKFVQSGAKNGLYPTRVPKRPNENALQAMRHMVSPNEYARMERVTSHLLLRLEGHVSAISDIHLSAVGDRVLTASSQDCNVRIWSFSPDYVKSVHIVLDMSEEEEEGLNLPRRVRGGGRNNGNNGAASGKSQVYNVCWTRDDLRVISVQSVVTKSGSQQAQPTRLKVWDSYTGDLLRVIPFISEICSRVLMAHPLNPSLALTSGEDGFVHVWDLEKEQSLSKTKLMNPDGISPAFIVDAAFSPDGSRISVTDFLGRLTLLGLDDPAAAKDRVLPEQYFSTDYANIMLDEVGFAIDVGTQIPVHEAPVGLLCKMDGTPYNEQPCLKTNGPQPWTKSEVTSHLSEIETKREKLFKQMERVFRLFQNNRGRLPRKYQNPFSNAKKSSNATGIHSNIVTLSSLNNRRPTEEENILLSSDDSDENMNNRTRRGQQSNRIRTLRQYVGGHLSEVRRSNRSRPVMSYNEDDDLGESRFPSSHSNAPSRAERAAMRAERRRVINDDDDLEDTSSNDSESVELEEMDFDMSSPEAINRRLRRSERKRDKREKRDKPSRKALKKLKTPTDTLHMIEGISDNENQQVRRYRRIGGWNNTLLGLRTIPQDTTVDRLWLQTDSQSESQYSPQLGDRVMYFPQGHIEVLRSFSENSSPPWISFPQKWPIVECEVKDIRYDFPTAQEHRRCNSVIAILTLVIVKVPCKRSFSANGQYNIELIEPRQTRSSDNKTQEMSFQVTLRNSHAPDFLIPSVLFYRSVRSPWFKGLKVTVKFKETSEEGELVFKPYSGSIAGLTNSSGDWPASPWESLEVLWDDSVDQVTADRVGPWEAIPEFDSATGYKAIYDSYQLPKLPDDESARIATEIRSILNQSPELFNPFEFEVDSSIFPDYYSFIPLPIYLDLILRRLQNGYYRQILGLIFDVNQIYDNCTRYNDLSSAIVSTAQHLKNLLLHIINPLEFPSPEDETQNETVMENETFLEGHSDNGDKENTQEKSNSSDLTIRFNRKRGQSDISTDKNVPGDTLLNPGKPLAIVVPRGAGANHSKKTGNGQGWNESASEEDVVLRVKRPRNSTKTQENSSKTQQNKDLFSDGSFRQNSATSSPVRSTRSRRQLEVEPQDFEFDEEPQVRTRRNSRGRRETTGQEKEHETNMSSPSRTSRRQRKTVSYAEDGDDNGDDVSFQGEASEEDSEAESERRRPLRRRDKTQFHDDDDDENDVGRRSGRNKKKEVFIESPERNVRSSSRRMNSNKSIESQIDQASAGGLNSSRSGRVIKNRVIYAPEKDSSEEDSTGKASKRGRRNSEDSKNIQKIDRSIKYDQIVYSSAVNGNRRIDPEVRKQLLMVLQKADEVDSEFGIFNEPVKKEDAPGYYQIIKNPVDLQTLRMKVQHREFSSVEELINQIFLMYDNCVLYNDPSSLIGKTSKKQKKEFLQFIEDNNLSCSL